MDRGIFPLVIIYHPALNKIHSILSRPQPTQKASKEHKRVFPRKPVCGFRHAKNLKDLLFRARLAPEGQEDLVKGCY